MPQQTGRRAVAFGDSDLPTHEPRPEHLKGWPSNAQFSAAMLESLVAGDEQEEAAAKLQAVRRGQQARRELELPDHGPRADHLKGRPSNAQFSAAMLESLVAGDEQEEAAAKLQAVRRGQQSRRKVQMASDLPDHGPRPEHLKGRPSNAQFSAAMLESLVAGDEQEEAAAKLQAMRRGQQARRKVSAASDLPDPVLCQST